MDKNEIIERLREIAKHAVHVIGEEPFIMSLDDGMAVHEAIDIMQQSQPQRTGRWIPQKGGGLCCSECGGYALDEPDGNFIHVAVPSKFCPNCGARMEGES